MAPVMLKLDVAQQSACAGMGLGVVDNLVSHSDHRTDSALEDSLEVFAIVVLLGGQGLFVETRRVCHFQFCVSSPVSQGSSDSRGFGRRVTDDEKSRR